MLSGTGMGLNHLHIRVAYSSHVALFLVCKDLNTKMLSFTGTISDYLVAKVILQYTV